MPAEAAIPAGVSRFALKTQEKTLRNWDKGQHKMKGTVENKFISTMLRNC